MVQNSPAVSLDRQQLAQILGKTVNDSDFIFCLKNLEIQSPNAGQQFWQAADNAPGIYIILSGKVRLVDKDRQLIVTLNQGDTFGEDTLFSAASFQTYSARASIDVKIGYLSEGLLKKLDDWYSYIEDYLYQQAVWRNWLLLSPSIAAIHKQPGFTTAFSLLQRHNLPRGTLPDSLPNCRLWLLRRGQIRHSSGQELNDGSIYTPGQQSGDWEVTQPTEIYSLDESRWHKAVENLPQLTQLIDSDNLPTGVDNTSNNSKKITDSR
jgi:hypothetical protein